MSSPKRMLLKRRVRNGGNNTGTSMLTGGSRSSTTLQHRSSQQQRSSLFLDTMVDPLEEFGSGGIGSGSGSGLGGSSNGLLFASTSRISFDAGGGGGHNSDSGSNLFFEGPRDGVANQSVNLMDHTAGVYQPDDVRKGKGASALWGKLQTVVLTTTSSSSSSSSRPTKRQNQTTSTTILEEHFDADAAEQGDAIFQLKDAKKPLRHRIPWRSVAAGADPAEQRQRRRRRLCCLLIAAKLLALLVLFLIHRWMTDRYWSGMTTTIMTEEELRAQNDDRFNKILDQILEQGITGNRTVFLMPGTAESRALRWVAHGDPARLSPNHPILLQRYTLAVFYYQSYLAYAQSNGKNEASLEEMDGPKDPGWTRHDHWMSKKGICLWYGVECQTMQVPPAPSSEGEGTDDATSTMHEVTRYDGNAHVTSLNLTHNGVYGRVPSEIARGLYRLQRLDLSSNRLDGTLSGDGLERLTSLTALHLNRNHLTGTLPTELGRLQSMESMQLSRNRLTGTIPTEINRLYKLQLLWLHHNRLLGKLPDLGQCHPLSSLSVHDNLLTGRLPLTIARSKNLQELRLDHNSISGTIPPEFESIHKLRQFQVNDNRLTGTLQSHLFTKLTNLVDFRCQNNLLWGTVPGTFGSTVTTVMLGGNKFTGTLPAEPWT